MPDIIADVAVARISGLRNSCGIFVVLFKDSSLSFDSRGMVYDEGTLAGFCLAACRPINGGKRSEECSPGKVAKKFGVFFGAVSTGFEFIMKLA